MEKRRDNKSHKSGKSFSINEGNFASQKDTNVHLEIATTSLHWAPHEHALSYPFLDCSRKVSRVTFPILEIATKMFYGQTSVSVDSRCFGPSSVELILAVLTVDCAPHSVSRDVSNYRNNKNLFPLPLSSSIIISSISHSVLSDSLQSHGLQPTRLLCPWDSPGKNTGMGCNSLLQGIFPSRGLNPGLFAVQADSLPSEPPSKPYLLGNLI